MVQMFSKRSRRFILAYLCLVLGSPASIVPLSAQDSRVRSPADSAQDHKQVTFEVISIRPHKPGADPLDRQYTPDGYRATITIQWAIELAYMPQPPLPWSSLKILHAPDWTNDWYDIDARVAPKDMEAWQQAGPDIYGSEPLRSAMRAALKDRCKLAAHMTTVEVPYWNIVMGKHGAALKDSVPGSIKPVVGKSSVAGKGFYIEDRGTRQFVGVSMDDLAIALMRLTKDYPVQNKTGLTGRYDFTVPWYSYEQHPVSEISNPLDRMPMSSIGLVLERGHGLGLTIDIDHIERPSEN
jgi:uncharacterized protein (TIGR03435 family)